MRGLTIIVAAPDPERFHAVLSLAAAQAALGARARLFLHGAAVGLLKRPCAAPADAARAGVGLPRLAELLEDGTALGVDLIVCQSGLALTGMTATALDAHVQVGGMIELLGTLGEDRLLFA